MLEIPQDQKIEVAVEEWKWLSPEDPRVATLTGVDLINAFRLTAKILDDICYEIMASYETVLKQPLYWGLVWLALKARAEGLFISGNTAQDDMSREQKYVASIFDPMKMPWVIEILSKIDEDDEPSENETQA